MNEIQKSRVRLAHWIDHNLDHLKGYLEVAQVLEAGGYQESALKIREGIRLIETANAEFQKALSGLSIEADDSPQEAHGATHAHEHMHEHAHAHCHDDLPEHSHPHGHAHSHPHSHSHSHAHESHDHGSKDHCCTSSHNHCGMNHHKH